MTIGMTTYLQFPGNAREAMMRYAEIFGGELDLLTYAEGMGDESENSDRIMHSSLFLARGAHIMAADLPEGWSGNGLGTVALSASDDDPAENARIASWWDRLAEQSAITVPLAEAPWDPNSRFGQLRDQFGVEWMFMIGPTA